MFHIGPWTIWLAVNKDGRFPDMDRHITKPENAATHWQLAPPDAAFLVQSLPKLPADEEFNYPITVDLNGRIAVRAKAVDQSRPTEVVLSNSSWSGDPIRLNTNRHYLARYAAGRRWHAARLSRW